MTRLIIDVPEQLRQQVARRASETGHASVESYIHHLLRADANGIDYGAPSSVRASEGDEVVAKLHEGLESGPARELTDSDWRRKLDRLNARRNEPGLR